MMPAAETRGGIVNVAGRFGPRVSRLRLIACATFVSVALAFFAGDVTSSAHAAPPSFPTNTVSTFTFHGCRVNMMHGQYGSVAYAQLRNDGSGSVCVRFISQAYVVGSNTPGQSIKSAPADGVWYQGVRSGTHDFSRFLIRSTAFGLQCELDLVVNNSGSYNYLITYVSGYGSCPWSF
jgi:hypothetical protein